MPTHFLFIIDILGTLAFAVSGAFLAMQKKLDPFGVLVLSFVTAIGGGTLRDINYKEKMSGHAMVSMKKPVR